MYAKDSGGGGGSYTVDSDAISGHGTSVNDLARDIRDKMTLMQRKLDTLQGQWKGTASNSFASVYRDWERQQNNVRDSLGNIGRALGKSAEDYRNTEHSVRARFTTPS